MVEALHAGTKIHELWVQTPVTSAAKRAIDAAQTQSVTVKHVSPRELDNLLTPQGGEASTPVGKHQGFLAVADPVKEVPLADLLAEQSSYPLFLCFDQVTDPQNAGAMLRTAVAFGVKGVVMTKRRSVHLGDAVARSSAGAVEHAKICLVTNLAQTLSLMDQHQIECVGLAADGSVDLDQLPPPNPNGRALVVGAEGAGLRRLVRERCHLVARIPMHGPMESLNAATAASVALYAADRQRRQHLASECSS